MQGGHQVAQKFNTTTFPRSASFPKGTPERREAWKSGAGLPIRSGAVAGISIPPAGALPAIPALPAPVLTLPGIPTVDPAPEAFEGSCAANGAAPRTIKSPTRPAHRDRLDHRSCMWISFSLRSWQTLWGAPMGVTATRRGLRQAVMAAP